MGFYNSIKGKGIIKTVQRGTLILKRYGISKTKMISNIQSFNAFLNKYDILPTYPIPGKILNKYWANIESQKDNAEYAVHGLHHIDLSELNSEECRKQLKSAKSIFQQKGFQNIGFRAPYLRITESTLKIIADLGFIYDSSISIHYDVIQQKNNNYNRAISYYHPFNTPDPGKQYGISVYPVAMPDDEIIIDRLNIKNNQMIYKIWEEMLNIAMRENQLLVMQIHPERFPILKDALRQFVPFVLRQGYLIKPLSKVTKPCVCITGDIDCMAMIDYLLK